MAKEDRAPFSRNLIAWRKKKGLSQRDLAQSSGISYRMVAYYETHSVIPPADKLDQLALALNVTVAELLNPDLDTASIVQLNTRSLKKLQLLEQLTPEDQRKVMEYIKALATKSSSQHNS